MSLTITKRMYDLLKKYEIWESNLLNSDEGSVIDEMSDEEYDGLMELQKERNNLIYTYENNACTPSWVGIENPELGWEREKERCHKLGREATGFPGE